LVHNFLRGIFEVSGVDDIFHLLASLLNFKVDFTESFLFLSRGLYISVDKGVRQKQFFQARPLTGVVLSHHTENVFKQAGRRAHFKYFPELAFVFL
jgi:hypothetical protein